MIYSIGIFGLGCSGKTTIAKALSSKLDLDVRLCGEEVRRAADNLGVSPSELSLDEHRRIDQETRSFVQTRENTGCVIEGHFLDHVLSSCQRIYLVQLICDIEIRQQRFCSRERSARDSFNKREELDRHVRRLLYIEPSAEPSLTIDTTSNSPNSIVDIIAANVVRGIKS